MFYYYWQERSFYYRTPEEIEHHIIEVNEILTSSNVYDHFYKAKNFLEFPYGKYHTIQELLYVKIDNMQLQMRVIPYVLKRFESIDTIVSVEQMENRFPGKLSSFIGPYFCNIKTPEKFIVDKAGYINNRETIIRNTLCGKNFEPYCSIMLRKVIFTKEAFKMVKSCGQDLNKIFEDAVNLDRYIRSGFWKGTFNVADVQSNGNVVISDESDTVKQEPKLKSHRLFKIPELSGTYCFLHLKAGDVRIHIYPNEQEKIVYVPYIGPHLPTKRF